MTFTARAITFHGSGQPLVATLFSLPKLGTGEVLIKVAASTLCGSDLHTYRGDRTTPCPTILGHEILGTVADLPAGEPVLDHDGNELQIGDRVTWGIAAACGSCFFCDGGVPQKCEKLFKYGHERITDDHPLSGGLAEFCHLAAGTPILRLPEMLPDRVACPANCATATVAAALRTAGVCRDRILLIQGAGMLGLTAAAMARSLGAAEVILTDVANERLARGLEFGATQIVSATEQQQLQTTVKEVTSGRGADCVLDFSGSPAAMQQGLDLLRIGGRAIWVGAVFPTAPVPLIPEQIVRRLISIHGVHNYCPDDLAAAAGFLTDFHRRFPFEELVGQEFALKDVEAAFQAAEGSGTYRVMVRP